MELSDSNRNQVSRFVTYFRGKRERLMGSFGAEQEEFKGDRLCDDEAIFNRLDVIDLIDAFGAQVLGQLREEVDEIINTSAVYITQLLAQAEQANLLLDVDVSSISEQHSTTEIAAMANSSTAPPVSLRKQGGALPTLAAPGGPDPVVMAKMRQLEEENAQMTARYQQMQAEVSKLLMERSTLSQELDKAHGNFHQVVAQMQQMHPDAGGSGNVMEVEKALNDTRVMLAAKQGECEQIRAELGQRVGETTQFRELKAIVKKKSEEAKEYRRRLMEAGLPATIATAGGIELLADD